MDVLLIVRPEGQTRGGMSLDANIRKTPVAGNLQRVPGLKEPLTIKKVEDGDGDWYRWTVYFEAGPDIRNELIRDPAWRLMGD